jgi:uncharacterized protein
MTQNEKFDNYLNLLRKVDSLFETVKRRHEHSFKCMSGCYGCCQPGLSVSEIEWARINEWLQNDPDTRAKIHDLKQMLNQKDFCRLLDRDGRCSIYEVRPLICRSHGMPVSWTNDTGDSNQGELRDVCPLNFTGESLDDLSSSDVLSLDKINTLLSLINRQYDEGSSQNRHLLDQLVK